MKSLSQIAKELGVSTAAVSYVYNDKWRENRINEELANRIRQKIEDERGRPNILGQLLRGGKTKTIGVILADLERDYNLELLNGIEQHVAAADYLLLLGNSKLGKKEGELIDIMLDRCVDGLIIAPMQSTEMMQKIPEIQKTEKPVVFVDNYIQTLSVPYVVSDNKQGAFDAVNYCIMHKKKKIAYLGTEYDKSALVDRLDGYKMAMKDAGCQLLLAEHISYQGVYDFIKNNQPDAVIACSFIYFYDGLKAIHDLNIQVPDDMLLIGFDRISEECYRDFPNINSQIPYLYQDAVTMGKKAAEMLLKLIDNKKVKNTKHLFKPELMKPGNILS